MNNESTNGVFICFLFTFLIFIIIRRESLFCATDIDKCIIFKSSCSKYVSFFT